MFYTKSENDLDKFESELHEIQTIKSFNDIEGQLTIKRLDQIYQEKLFYHKQD